MKRSVRANDTICGQVIEQLPTERVQQINDAATWMILYVNVVRNDQVNKNHMQIFFISLVRIEIFLLPCDTMGCVEKKEVLSVLMWASYEKSFTVLRGRVS